MDVHYDYNLAFKSISEKLKKKFLRKPNVSDAIDEYTALSKQLDSEESFSLSAACWQQVAKCYHSVGNVVSESAALQNAAKNYLHSETATTIESNNITFNEDLLSVISTYDEAIKLHCDQNERVLSAKLCLELADILAVKYEKYFESIPYYERAISLSVNSESSQQLQVALIQLKLAAIKVFTCDYLSALKIYTEITNSISNMNLLSSSRSSSFRGSDLTGLNQIFAKPQGLSARLLTEADISKLLLLIYSNPTKLQPEQKQTLEVYSSFQTLSNSAANYLPVICLNRNIFILLQSFVMACQSNDVKLLHTLQTELWPQLSDVQNYLLNMIIDQIVNSSYTDDLLSQ